jgi:hypothetical protein
VSSPRNEGLEAVVIYSYHHGLLTISPLGVIGAASGVIALVNIVLLVIGSSWWHGE